MLAFLKKQKMTLAALASFGLAAAGISSFGDKPQETAKSTFTQPIKKHHTSTGTTSEYDIPTDVSAISRRAPQISKVQWHGKAQVKVNRKLYRNQFPSSPEKELSKIVRDNHIASVNERAKEAQQKAKDETALAANDKKPETADKATEEKKELAANGDKKEKTLTEIAGGKEGKEDQATSLDYRRKLLRKAVTEVLSSEEPWKELIAIALVQADIQDYTGARDTLTLAKRMLPSPSENKQLHSDALVSITQGYCRINKRELALDTAVYISDKRAQNQAISSVVSSCLQNKEFSEAKTLAASLSLVEFREASFRNIAEAEANDGKHSPALSTASLISNMSMRNDALRRISLTQAKAKLWDTALSTAGLISNPDTNQNTLAEIIRIRIDVGEINAVQVAIAAINNETTRDDLYGRLAKKQASLGNITGARRNAELITLEINKENTLAAIAVQQARFGNTIDAFNKASALVNHAPQSQGVRDVTLIEANMRGTSSAYNMAAMIENIGTRDATLRAMAQREAGIGNINAAVNCAHSINAPDCQVLSLAETALSSIKKTPTRQAVTILESTTQMANNLDVNNNIRNEAIIKLANGYALINRLNETVSYVEQLSNVDRRNSAYEQIAYDCVSNNNLNGAQQLAEKITDPNRRKNTMINLAQRHANNVLPENSNTEVDKFKTKEERSSFLRAMARKN